MDDDQALREIDSVDTNLEEREMVDGATTAGEDAPTITATDERPEGEIEHEHSPSASQKRGRGRRKKFKTAAATSERTDDAPT